jgi:GNAT superfamily N-acetyltransferase
MLRSARHRSGTRWIGGCYGACMARWATLEDRQAAFDAMVRPLVEGGVLAPLVDSAEDAQLWMDCDLCSFIENRCHHRLDPACMTAGDRAAWTPRVLPEQEHPWDPRRSEFLAAYWILDRGVRAGTLALSTAMSGYLFLPVYSLYVFPRHRGTGLAYRALRAADRAAVVAGFSGIRVGANWTWQSTVRRYLLRYGMWAWSFKRSIDLVWADLPPHAITIDDRTARFAVTHDERTIELLTARRDGEVLIWNEAPEMSSGDLSKVVQFHARSTFSVALAVHGWPLLRAGDDLDDAAVYDAGGPAVLAYKIGVFEALDHRRGFDVRTPRIPGLPYDAIAHKLAG